MPDRDWRKKLREAKINMGEKVLELVNDTKPKIPKPKGKKIEMAYCGDCADRHQSKDLRVNIACGCYCHYPSQPTPKKTSRFEEEVAELLNKSMLTIKGSGEGFTFTTVHNEEVAKEKAKAVGEIISWAEKEIGKECCKEDFIYKKLLKLLKDGKKAGS